MTGADWTENSSVNQRLGRRMASYGSGRGNRGPLLLQA